MDSINSAVHWRKVMDDRDAVEKHLDYLLQKAMIEMHDCAGMRDGMQALIQAMNFMAQYMKDYQKEMHDGQAHQQSKERRREEKPTESEEGFENPYHCRQEDGSEDAEVRKKTHFINVAYSGMLADRLADSIDGHGPWPVSSYIGTLKDGCKYEVTVRLK